MVLRYLFLILFYSINIIQIYSIVVIPFQISLPKEENLKYDYSINDFFLDNYQRDFYSSINVGEKDIRILTRISPDNYTFFLSEKECNRESVKNAQNYLIMTRNSYSYQKSKSYKNISMLNNSLTNYKNGGIISEYFSFYNTTKLKCQYLSYDHNIDKILDTKINITDMKIILEDYEQDKGCAVIGIGTNYTTNNEEINFINELKKNKAINDYSFTIKYITNSDGQLIIGGLPHEYYNNSKNYKSNQYIKINSYSNKDYNLPWFIIFNKIFFENKNNETISIQNSTKSFIVHNLGFIIGTTEYKNLIFENYFKALISEEICVLEKTNNIGNKLFFYQNETFEIFSCNLDIEKDKYRNIFPNLKFQQNDFNYIFNLSFFELFLKINRFDKYYFLVIFPENKNMINNNNWYLGSPFLKKYQFIFNYDSKTIGFYNDKIEDKKDTDINDIKSNSYIRIIIEVSVGIFLIVLIFVAFIVGKTIEKRRKKRANELTDDNYEYFSNENDIKKDMNLGI